MVTALIVWIVAAFPLGVLIGRFIRVGKGPRPTLPEYMRGNGPCMDCGTRDTPVWFTDNHVWNRVVGGPGTTGDPGGLLCPVCFIRRAGEAGIKPPAWKLTPERPWLFADA